MMQIDGYVVTYHNPTVTPIGDVLVNCKSWFKILKQKKIQINLHHLKGVTIFSNPIYIIKNFNHILQDVNIVKNFHPFILCVYIHHEK
jgi:hypothetical protein